MKRKGKREIKKGKRDKEKRKRERKGGDFKALEKYNPLISFLRTNDINDTMGLG